jgi:hypothetical protein
VLTGRIEELQAELDADAPATRVSGGTVRILSGGQASGAKFVKP